MTCEEVRDLLPEHLLGSLDDTSDARVRKHLRGCADCRAERMRLEDGVAALSHATHEQDPPEELRRHVLDVLSEEWDEPGEQPAAPAGSPGAHGSAWRWLAVAAAVILVAVSLSYGVSQSRHAASVQADAGSYQALLDALGGKEFRLGTLQRRRRRGGLRHGGPVRRRAGQGLELVGHRPGQGPRTTPARRTPVCSARTGCR